jgi:predicted nucleotidyltransferase component of viral defense system
MGKIQIFTKNQQAFLHLVSQNEYITNRFYFTGGTALSAYYLHHRYSDDLDIFSEQEIETNVLLPLMTDWSKELGFTFTARFIEVVYRCVLTFSSGTPLKVDFSYYPYKRLQPSKRFDGIPVDSRFDIAVNKLVTLTQRQDVKDFVDSYFLWQHESFYDLVAGMEKKFHLSYDPITLSSDLLMVEDCKELPRMIRPLKLDDLKQFFRKKAKALGSTSVI